MTAHKHDPKRTEEYGEVTYGVAWDQDIPEHLIRAEQAKAKTERWRARLGL